MGETGGLLLAVECQGGQVKVEGVLMLESQVSAVRVKTELGGHHQRC